ncbi:MAG: iron ABC transporter permease, partial [Brevundimonas sp.]|uniref:iron chelate uptake ABC transporter family permease subunit n=1 Tax=Brevundimonas sp. TaxID=1871086 RepID=UPI0012100B0E
MRAAERRLIGGLTSGALIAIVVAVLLGEASLSFATYLEALRDPSSAPGQVLWQVRAPRAICAFMVGAAALATAPD